MDDTQFTRFLDELQTYLKTPKVFVTDLKRAREFYIAVDIAKRLFPGTEIEIKDDPLQTGAMILKFITLDVTVRGAKEINLFSDMIALADNFEIYPVNSDEVCFSVVFQGVHKLA